MIRSLLFIEPKNGAAAKPLIDDLTRKITAAYRAAEPGKECYFGVHTCVCGAKSACRDYYLPDGTMTNSLCIHYVAKHRSEVPEKEIDRVSRLTFGQCIPSEVELCGGRAPENLTSDFIGRTRLETLESMGILLRPVISAADRKELNEAIRYFRLVEIFVWMPTSAITPFVVALRKTDQEPESWSRAAQTAEGFRAATFEPLVGLLDDQLSRWYSNSYQYPRVLRQ